jgi:RNA polymerase sigma-70 factor (ECF subfamily)
MEENCDQPLDRISTLWSVVCQAHGPTPEASAAQLQLLSRYGGAVRRYLLGAVRDPEAADDLFQEFSLRLVRGDLARADPERGRFRSYVKGILVHLVSDHHRRRARDGPLIGEVPERPDPSEGPSEEEFMHNWREELLARAWEALEGMERQGGQPFHAVLRLRADQPNLDSAHLAAVLTDRLGRPVSVAWVRQNLHRAREKFVEFLLAEVAQTLDRPGSDDLESELIDLDLYEYCRPSLQGLRAARPPCDGAF